jgi:hypothetical protein
LAPGAINSTAWTRGLTNTRVDCAGKCLGVGVTGSCKSGESCWVS